jgi:hypothetical protein
MRESVRKNGKENRRNEKIPAIFSRDDQRSIHVNPSEKNQSETKIPFNQQFHYSSSEAPFFDSSDSFSISTP